MKMIDPYNLRLSKRKRFRGLREVVLDIIAKSRHPITSTQILEKIDKYFLPFESTVSTINNLLQKLARYNLIKYVYLDLAYGVQLIEKGKEEYNLLIS